MKKATLADVAEKAEVSKASVSRYLKQENVRKDIADKIIKAIEETGYVVPSMTSEKGKEKKSVITEKESKTIVEEKSQKKKTVVKKKVVVKKGYRFAIMVKDITSLKVRNVVKALQEEFYDNGCSFQILVSEAREELEEQYLTSCIVSNVNAVIIDECSSVEFIQKQMRTTAIPVIFLNDQAAGIHSQVIDEEKAGAMLAEYMLHKKHLIIRYLGVKEATTLIHMNSIKNVYRNVKQPLDFSSKKSDGSYEDVFEKLKEIFEEKIDLLILQSDDMAIPLSKYSKEYHINIPQNVSVISFGGHEVSKFMSPTLVCLAYDYEAYAKNISRYLFSMIEKTPLPKEDTILYMQDGDSVR